MLIFTGSKILNLNSYGLFLLSSSTASFSSLFMFKDSSLLWKGWKIRGLYRPIFYQLLKLNFKTPFPPPVVPILCLSWSHTYLTIYLKISLSRAFLKHFFFSYVIRSLSCELRHLNSSLSRSAKGYREGNGKVIPLRFPICTWIWHRSQV